MNETGCWSPLLASEFGGLGPRWRRVARECFGNCVCGRHGSVAWLWASLRYPEVMHLKTRIRRAAIAIGVCVLLFPREGYVTSHGVSAGFRYKGYSVAKSIPSDPNATKADRAAIDAEMKESLLHGNPIAARAFSHYVQGKHPYVAVLSYLLPDVKDETESVFWRTSPVELLAGVEVTLFVKPNIPDVIRNQIPRDFLLSQLSPGGVLSKQGGLSEFPKPTDSRPPEVVLEHGLYNVHQVVYAIHNRDRIRQSISTVGPGSQRGIVLQAIAAVLDGKPIPSALTDAALLLPPTPKADTFALLLDLSPRTDAAQVQRWVSQLGDLQRSRYVDTPQAK